VSIASRMVQSVTAFIIARMKVGTPVDEELNNGFIPTARGQMKWSKIVAVSRSQQVRVLRKHCFDLFQFALMYGLVNVLSGRGYGPY